MKEVALERMLMNSFWTGFEKRALAMPNWKYRLGEAAIGGAIGAGAGALHADKDRKWRGAVGGAALGAGGALAGSQLTRSVRKIPLGRVHAEDIPETFFHGAPKSYAEKIQLEGLIPGKGISKKTHSGAGTGLASTHVYLSKDPTYAESYGKYITPGNYSPSAAPNMHTVVLPKELAKKTQRANDLGYLTHNGKIMGSGSEFLHEGPIAPRYIANDAESAGKLKANLIQESIKNRTGKVDRKLFGIGGL